MEPGGSMLNSQGLSNNPYPKLIIQFLVLIYISLRSILILSSHLRPGLSEGLFPAGVPVKILKALPNFFHSGYTTCPSKSSILNHPDFIRWTVAYKPLSFSLRSLLHSPFSSLLDPNIRLRILFSNVLSLQLNNMEGLIHLSFVDVILEELCFIINQNSLYDMNVLNVSFIISSPLIWLHLIFIISLQLCYMVLKHGLLH